MDHTPPDFADGIALARLPDGSLLAGKVGDEDVLLARRGDEIFAVGAKCTHYGADLAEGLMVGDQIRCPWHHACFSLRTGAAIRRPALDSLSCWRVEQNDGRVFVRERLAAADAGARRAAMAGGQLPASILIIGGGAAALSAADTLRLEGYEGSLTMISADPSAPCDRPNLSKDYLAGKASDDWVALRRESYYQEQHIELLLNTRVTAVDNVQRRVHLDNGKSRGYDRLLLATGAEPIHLTIPGAEASELLYLRSYADSHALVEKAKSAQSAIVLGGSFIGLEVASSLRARGLAVHVVTRDKLPLDRILGPEVGAFVRRLHESQGIKFYLEDTIARMDGRIAVLRSGTRLAADLLVLGVGVRPEVSLAEQAGLKVDNGVLVDEYLETSERGIFAAGDIARWPDPHSGELIRVEHWVVAGRQGQTAARNLLGRRERFDAVPFFWTQQFDVSMNYVGHASKWDRIDIDGDLDAKDCTVVYRCGERTAAVLTMGRDLQSLRSEAQMEKR